MCLVLQTSTSSEPPPPPPQSSLAPNPQTKTRSNATGTVPVWKRRDTNVASEKIINKRRWISHDHSLVHIILEIGDIFRESPVKNITLYAGGLRRFLAQSFDTQQ